MKMANQKQRMNLLSSQKGIYILFVLISLQASLLVASNAVGAKIITFFGLTASATVVTYAFTFLITDIISEVYGKKWANTAVLLGAGAILIAVGIYQLAIMAPSAATWENQEAFETTLGLTWRLFVGGILAYLVSQHIDVFLFHQFRKMTDGRWLWLRNNGSTLISQFIDTLIFITISFYGMFPLFPIIFGQYLIKVTIALIDTPLMYLARRLLLSKMFH